jgi:hypothetical protein
MALGLPLSSILCTNACFHIYSVLICFAHFIDVVLVNMVCIPKLVSTGPLSLESDLWAGKTPVI